MIMSKRYGNILSRNKVKILLIVGILLVLIHYFSPKSGKVRFNPEKFDTEKVSIGNLEKIVTATGTINPVNVISVGSQVSGKIEKVYVDYNDVVKKNQKLAKLETDILEKSLKEQGSILKQSLSNLKLVELDTKRVRELFKNKYIAKTELDRAENDLINAKENYNVAKSKYERSKTELGYAYIDSPVAGIVISRNIDEGQTVAASFSAPVLFTIAENLEKMQIETSISESDIGLIKSNTGSELTFTVDAYKDRLFSGKIKQIRLNPTVESNVVVYNVIIEIDNKDGLLLPGMTAYVSIIIDSSKNALRIPNTVLRFKNSKEARAAMGLSELTKDEKDELSKKIKEGYANIYVVDGNKVRSVLIKKGISDITYTEIKSSEVKDGDVVISSFLGKTKGKD
jgi:HlyD family secretion protein